MARQDFRKIASTALSTLLWCAAAGLLVQNWILVRENRSLSARLSAPPAPIEQGRKLYAIAGANSRGEFKTLSLPVGQDDKLLIVTFSPGCPACRANLPGWLALESQIQKQGWQVAWVSRDPVDYTQKYLLENNLDSANVLADPTMRTYRQLGLEMVPNTLVVGSGGVVLQVWMGQLTSDKWSEVFSYFKLPEPGFLSAANVGQAVPATAPGK